MKVPLVVSLLLLTDAVRQRALEVASQKGFCGLVVLDLAGAVLGWHPSKDEVVVLCNQAVSQRGLAADPRFPPPADTGALCSRLSMKLSHPPAVKTNSTARDKLRDLVNDACEVEADPSASMKAGATNSSVNATGSTGPRRKKKKRSEFSLLRRLFEKPDPAKQKWQADLLKLRDQLLEADLEEDKGTLLRKSKLKTVPGSIPQFPKPAQAKVVWQPKPTQPAAGSCQGWWPVCLIQQAGTYVVSVVSDGYAGQPAEQKKGLAIGEDDKDDDDS
mmetsp:Transcript_28441/g.68368  ORF Transcript_28441/g.68368 Transcript_28441/m.68368 type:complete len:274 (+) Transcript_28441:92-913(+)